ncbi:MAG TPA: hypothetical protein VIK01_21715 [Polyangiaceae bacterium]
MTHRTHLSSFSHHRCTRIRKIIAALWLLVSCAVGCARDSGQVPQSDYARQIVGRWQGTVGNSKETMSLAPGGAFVCHLQPTGFIANTLSQRAVGVIRGTWTLSGKVITLRITSADHELPTNALTSSTIVAFKDDELSLKSDRGDSSTFRRVQAL